MTQDQRLIVCEHVGADRIIVHRDGTISGYGRFSLNNRVEKGWRYCGTLTDIIAEIKAANPNFDMWNSILN